MKLKKKKDNDQPLISSTEKSSIVAEPEIKNDAEVHNETNNAKETIVPTTDNDTITESDTDLENQQTPHNTEINTSSRIPKIDDLIDEIKKEKSQKKEPLKPDPELAQKAIDERIEKTNSQIIINVLRNVQIEAEGDKFNIYVPSKLAKDTLGEEKKLLNTIREYHFNPMMDIEILVDLSKFPGHKEIVQKKVLSVREKYDLIKTINPGVEDFIKKFDLHSEI